MSSEAVTRNDLAGILNAVLPPSTPVRIETVTIPSTTSDQMKGQIVAPTVSGYQFVAWVALATDGYVGAAYAQDPISATTNVWDSRSGGTGCTIHAYALYQIV